MSSKILGLLFILLMHTLISMGLNVLGVVLFVLVAGKFPLQLSFPMGVMSGFVVFIIYTRQKLDHLFKSNNPPST